MDSEDKIQDLLEVTSKFDHDVLLKNEEEFKPRYLPISLLKAITKNFSDGLEIGRGGFAVVYKGLLKRGGTVAVKKLLNTICMDDTKFQKEVSCLMKVRHKNIVRFLGYCADTQGKMEDYNGKLILAEERQRLLCFEYLPNGSLEKYIDDVSSGLEWNKRFKIIKGICEGLQYLHENNIVHSDLKPANILLNDNMVPKISGFGQSRCFEEMQSQTVTSTLIGPMEYLPPEFFSGEITKKMDIYGLGVIIAEMLTGQKGHSPVEDVLECWRKRFEESSPDTEKLLEQVRVCAKILICCGNLDPTKRPDIQQITAILNEPSDSDEFLEMDSEDKIQDHLEVTSKCDHDVLLKNEEEFKPIYLPISLLKAITKNFSDGLEIGRGGFAVVYKGLLKRGGTVAVKKLLNTISMDDTKFQTEVRCLMKVRHKNIVRFLGYCADTQGKMEDYKGELILAEERQRLLCFEYLPNGSLEKYINDASSGLEWNKRFKIIKGICEGLQYLHENNIVHSDLKPANILLNDNMVPKISDFGQSRCFEEMQSRTVTSKIIGSLGYFPQEFYSGQITKKKDIYSLGVIIAEMLTGQKGYSPVEEVLECWRKRFGESSPDIEKLLEQVRVCAKIQMCCLELDPTKRPDIKQIAAILNEPSDTDEFPEVDFKEVFSSLVAMQHKERMPTRSWWWNSHISHKNSKWLAANIEDMEKKVKLMIKLLETNTDSFARRAEMYYKMRPELMKLIEEFYRGYRSLAERYDDLTVNLRKSIPISLHSDDSEILKSDSETVRYFGKRLDYDIFGADSDTEKLN